MQNGWIKLLRKLKKKGYYKKSEYVHLWVHLLLTVNHEPTEFMFNNTILKLAPGQLITGRLALARETKINRNKVERILKCFEIEQQIEQQKTNKFRLITIKNWNDYQQSEQQVSNKAATSEQQVSTYKEYKNIKKDKNNTNVLGEPEIIKIEEEDLPIENFDTPPSSGRPPIKPKLEKKEYGDPGVNAILNTLKTIIKLEDFTENQEWQRKYGKNLFNLQQKVGSKKIEEALNFLLSSWKKDRCNSLEFLWKELKTLYVPPKTTQSNSAHIS